MSSETDLPPELLRQEIERLLPAVEGRRGRTTGQHKAQLAALLFEAHRTEAHRLWRYKNLGQYARDQGMQDKVFAKYKSAGKVLHAREPEVYRALMTAIANGSPRP